jgi:hypothetical protein
MHGAIDSAPVRGAARVRLPAGLWRDGVHADLVWLAPLSASDELQLADLPSTVSPAAWAAALLGRVVPQLPVSDLTLGDRDALLLHSYAINYSGAAQCLCTCPGCAQRLDLELRIDELLVAPYPQQAAAYRVEFAEADGTSWRVQFRLPTVADIDAVLATCRAQPLAAARTVIERCLLEVVRDAEGGDCLPNSLPDFVLKQVADRIAEIDSQAELRFHLCCPVCALEFDSVIDPVDLLAPAVKSGAERAARDIHQLAYAYHWSEGEILALPATRRQRYVTLIARDGARESGR